MVVCLFLSLDNNFSENSQILVADISAAKCFPVLILEKFVIFDFLSCVKCMADRASCLCPQAPSGLTYKFENFVQPSQASCTSVCVKTLTHAGIDVH